MVKALFGSKDEVRLSDLKEKFYENVDDLKKSLYEAVVQAGYFTRSPEGVRSQFGCLGVAGIVASGVLSVLMLTMFGSLSPAAIVPGIGLAILSVGVLVMARYMPRKTDKGAQEAAPGKRLRPIWRTSTSTRIWRRRREYGTSGCPTPLRLAWTSSICANSSR